jgi:hypothetical protein
MTIVDSAKKFGCSELRNSEMARTVIELSDFVNLVNPPTSTLKLKMLKLKMIIIFCTRISIYELKFCMVLTRVTNLCSVVSYEF